MHNQSQNQNPCSPAVGSALLRCDKLDRDEVKNLLMCFLHILKSMSEGRGAWPSRPTWGVCFFLTRLVVPSPSEALFAYWNKAAASELMDFFTLVE